MPLLRKSPGSTALPNKLIDEWMLNMTGSEIKVMIALEGKFQNFGNGDYILSTENLKKATGLSQPSISKAINSLIQKGLIEKRKEGEIGKEKVIYTFNWWEKNED